MYICMYISVFLLQGISIIEENTFVACDWIGQPPVHGLGYSLRRWFFQSSVCAGMAPLEMAPLEIHLLPKEKFSLIICLFPLPAVHSNKDLGKMAWASSTQTWGDLFPVLPYSFPQGLLSMGELWPFHQPGPTLGFLCIFSKNSHLEVWLVDLSALA